MKLRVTKWRGSRHFWDPSLCLSFQSPVDKLSLYFGLMPRPHVPHILCCVFGTGGGGGAGGGWGGGGGSGGEGGREKGGGGVIRRCNRIDIDE